jgi:hypothetical protein
MDEIFGSPKMQRQTLRVNQRRGIKQHFGYNPNLGYKSKAEPSVVSWNNRGRGVQGESVNSQNPASKLIVRRNWKPV